MPGAEVMVAAATRLAFSNYEPLRATAPASETTRESGWWQEAIARSVNFKRDVAALIEPSGSAIFMLLRDADAPVVLKQLRDYGDTIVHTSLSPEQDNKMLALLTSNKENRS